MLSRCFLGRLRLSPGVRWASSSVSYPRRGRNLTERYRTLEKTGKTNRPTLLFPNGPTRTTPTDTDIISGLVIPKEPLVPRDDECCMSGCAVCVYDLYEEALGAYKESVETLRAALSARHVPEAEWPVHIRTGENGPTTKDNKSKDAVMDAFEAMERALKVKRDRRASIEAEKRARGEALAGDGDQQHDDSPQQRQHRPRHRRGGPRRGQQDQPSDSAPSESHPPRPSRRARFKATLTEPETPSTPPTESAKPKPRTRRVFPPGDDLTSTLTHALRTSPYPDCPICFNPIRPEHSTWSCSPPVSPGSTDLDEKTCCWNSFHLKCIRAWAEKSVKELEEAWRARGESKPGEWHCPGCRTTRQAVPQTYMCFCLRMRHPAPPRIATPHSCAQPCSRPRSGCKHACPLPCHPGPCPPCAVTIQVSCFCGKEKHSAKCQVGLGATSSSFSCTQPCLRQLECGNPDHVCAETCHDGPCPPCPAREEIQCWCGRATKYVACGEAKLQDATKLVVVEDDGSERTWMGSYGCYHPCERPFACSHHSCSKLCHPPSRTPPPCPFDPERVLSCACGRCRVARSSDELERGSTQSSSHLPPRSSCTSPLPTCTSPCSKPLPCGHLCKATCHWDLCPPCTQIVKRTCRCGATKHKSPCSDPLLAPRPANIDNDTPASETILCDKPCQALRVCGRHQCGRICCPLASQRSPAKSSKKRDPAQLDLDVLLQLDPAMRALHECDLPCGRVLACGNHRCQERDHKGPCALCPRGVFEELVCLCGRTVLEPPIQCGTVLHCVYPCARPPPACGHPHVPHGCHEGEVVAGADMADEGLGLGVREVQGACPPCPFLTEKLCACGKKRVGNVRCSQERVSCGSVCGKLLACGFHHCERLCHADACGTCTAVCGKSRKSCLPAHHPCTQTCHAPTACPETEPCLAPVMLTCPCGNLRSTIPCSGTKLTLACTGDCEIKKRNARLADALGISEEKRDSKGPKVTWSAELVGSARVMGPKFVGIVEKAFADFVHSDRRTQVLPHMPLERRKFVHDLASVYRMDTVMVDQEPHRSVQLIRRIDTRVPTPLVSQYIASTMGRLVELRSLAGGKAVGAPAGGGASASGSGSSNVGMGASGGTGRWNMVAKSMGGSRSGSTTPARVPSPAGDVTGLGRSGAVSAGGGTKSGTWVSPSVQALRAQERGEESHPQVPPSGAGAGDAQDVPDDWEDDV
ncbi:hypothetical protein JVU11DRAFT_7794 [Chiua virens]|nr:hypothetical protein JVU11DRAFT_7794 [Chiua virens]